MDLSLLKPLQHEGSREASQRLPHNVGPKDSYTQQSPNPAHTAVERNPVFPAPKNQVGIDCASTTPKLL